MSKFVDLVEKLGEGFHGGELEFQLQEADPNESGSLNCFDFMRWYMNPVEVPDGYKVEG